MKTAILKLSTKLGWILSDTKEEAVGRSFADFLHRGWRDHFKEIFSRFKAIGEILGVEFEMFKKRRPHSGFFYREDKQE